MSDHYIGRSPVYGQFDVQTITPDGTSTVYDLAYAVGSAASLLVNYEGVQQVPNVAYVLSSGGTKITFSEAPALGSLLYMVYLGKQLLVSRTADSDIITDQFAGDGTTTTFALSALPPSANCVIAFVDGIQQRKTTNFTISNQNIIFTTAPDSGAEIDVTIVGSERATINNVVDGSISTAKLQGLAVTPAKLSTGGPSWDTSGTLSVAAGLWAKGIFTGSFTDGIVSDYTTGMGRISVGAADGLSIYNGGVANTLLATILPNGNMGVGVTTPLAKLQISGTAFSTPQTLTDGATVSWDTSLGQTATITLGGNRTMAAPTNIQNGAFYALAVIQGAGSNTLSWNTVFKWTGGTAPTLTSSASAKDYFVFRSDGTNLYEQGRSQAVA